MSTNVVVEKRGAIGIIRINRPEALNALNEETLVGIERAIRECESTEGTRVIVLTGTGDKAFAAGADVTAMATMKPDQADAFAHLGHETMNAIEHALQPVIAAVNGYCLGGGMELALACDFIYASEKAKFGLPEVGLGLFPGWGGTQRLTRLLGKNRAKEIIFTGKMLTATEAFQMGIVNKVCKPEALLEETLATANEIAKKAPVPVRIAKTLINGACNTTLEDGLGDERAKFPECFRTEDLREGLRAFHEKREPIFQGK